MVWLIEIQCPSYLSYLFFMILSLSDSKCCFWNLKKINSKTLFHTFSSQSMLSLREPKRHSTHQISPQSIHQSKTEAVQPRKIESQWPDQNRAPKTKSRLDLDAKAKPVSMPKKTEYRCSRNTESRRPLNTEYRRPKRPSIDTQRRPIKTEYQYF